jgi:alpha-mannosidase
MLKLLVPTGFAPGGEYRGQGAFCRSTLPADGSEAVAQRWVAAHSGDKAVLVFTDFTYGSDYSDGTIRLNLLRTAAYAAHPILDRPLLPADRALARMDRGLRRFTFRVEAGSAELLDSADLRGLERGEKPWAISFFPPGGGKPVQPGCTLESRTGALVLSALKRAETGDGWIVRLYDPVGTGGSGMLRFPALGFGPFPVACGHWGIKTWKLGDDGSFTETDLAEGALV